FKIRNSEERGFTVYEKATRFVRTHEPHLAPPLHNSDGSCVNGICGGVGTLRDYWKYHFCIFYTVRTRDKQLCCSSCNDVWAEMKLVEENGSNGIQIFNSFSDLAIKGLTNIDKWGFSSLI
ncbi:hypothetical protein H5410_063044, partial [Solanum commersonii]